MGRTKDRAESRLLGAIAVNAPNSCANSNALLDWDVGLSGPKVIHLCGRLTPGANQWSSANGKRCVRSSAHRMRPATTHGARPRWCSAMCWYFWSSISGRRPGTACRRSRRIQHFACAFDNRQTEAFASSLTGRSNSLAMHRQISDGAAGAPLRR
jgi:hypothetical protein